MDWLTYNKKKGIKAIPLSRFQTSFTSFSYFYTRYADDNQGSVYDLRLWRMRRTCHVHQRLRCLWVPCLWPKPKNFANFVIIISSAVFNNLQGIPRFMDFMGLDKDAKEDQNLIGAVTSSYLAATIFSGLFMSPFISHYLGRRASIFTGCLVVIAASLIQSKWGTDSTFQLIKYQFCAI